ncbi:YhgE/Pip domain-containing protein [Bacillus sp. EAC]|uniref:YhgE/Pip domain-containing protein n=1 Tax=Bacillus sp. EAC TaxID=1978338 RepID=UPI000B4540C5|nr:ABC transporter permease [Bacillus sp. EAC]
MNLFKQKQALLAPLIVLVIAVIFSLTLASTVNPTPKNLPIAIVNLDQGVTIPSKGNVNMGAMMVSKVNELGKSTSDEPAIKWIRVSSEEKVRNGLHDRKYYAALVIPKDLSIKQASLKTANPSSATIQLLINQGMNSNASTMANQLLAHLIENINLNTRTEIFNELDKKGVTLSAKQASILANPIISTVENVNPIGTHASGGNAPVVLITPLWMSSLIGAVIVFFAKKKSLLSKAANRFKIIIEQLVLAIILAFVAGFGITLMANWIGINLPNFVDTALFLTIAYFCFHILISAVMSWIGLGGVGIFALIFFFSGSIIGMAPELLPNFTRDWIYSWVPMRFGADGLRGIFYFGEGISMSHSMKVLLWIGAVSLILLLSSTLKSKKEIKEHTVSIQH